jgi:hypothetical protein
MTEVADYAHTASATYGGVDHDYADRIAGKA